MSITCTLHWRTCGRALYERIQLFSFVWNAPKMVSPSKSALKGAKTLFALKDLHQKKLWHSVNYNRKYFRLGIKSLCFVLLHVNSTYHAVNAFSVNVIFVSTNWVMIIFSGNYQHFFGIKLKLYWTWNIVLMPCVNRAAQKVLPAQLPRDMSETKKKGAFLNFPLSLKKL